MTDFDELAVHITTASTAVPSMSADLYERLVKFISHNLCMALLNMQVDASVSAWDEPVPRGLPSSRCLVRVWSFLAGCFCMQDSQPEPQAQNTVLTLLETVISSRHAELQMGVHTSDAVSDM